MDAIDLMMEEHKNIKRMLKVIRKLCIKILNHEELDYNVFYEIIDFVRNYADAHHHSKEENILFQKMSKVLGEKIARGPIYGMLAEHDLGRLFISHLEEAVKKVQNKDDDAKVDIIANAIAYTDLLERHIEKEDHAIYTFAKRTLSKEDIKEVEEKCERVENLALQKNIPNQYIKLIEKLEKMV
ncbi:hemerythrin domain-containing protein [Inediibacterium massiliense]|uniref:hemerythrin domain-containing protein n=1 Tax=Inediibacterium massiliense TaxID=1658111 RepID=UPI0006B53939|nr:hemerythrin domain-containing protein [Inediibacterium massiliense]